MTVRKGRPPTTIGGRVTAKMLHEARPEWTLRACQGWITGTRPMPLKVAVFIADRWALNAVGVAREALARHRARHSS